MILKPVFKMQQEKKRRTKNVKVAFEIFALERTKHCSKLSMPFNNRSVKRDCEGERIRENEQMCTTFSVGCAEIVYNHLTMPCNLRA